MNFTNYIPEPLDSEERLKKSKAYYELLSKRRTIRHFSNEPIEVEVIKNIILTAGSAPSGAHKQPWTFCLVQDPSIKKEIRKAAEKEEYENYHGRMSEEWLNDLAKFGTDWNKPFLEDAPYLIVVFKKSYDLEDGHKKKNYYVQESVGIACGFLIAAIHQAGLASLTHTPSPMNFLSSLLKRPANEKPFLLIPVGLPNDNASVPIIDRKKFHEICKIY